MSDISVQQLILNHEKAFKPEAAEGVDAVIQYRLIGDEGGDWIITIQDGKCSVAEGLAENPKMTLTADAH
ncbi:MAG TPA: SCP2 sterol-binding domain-containing protein, partial [Anaerolineales bacterium]|nr:SCP2 sterol-binding domain-containing protein [Anaerolineales bacterium]